MNIRLVRYSDSHFTIGEAIESALDHTYLSEELKSRTTVTKLKYGSTDHLPVMATIEYKLKTKMIVKKKTIKRSMKNFNQANWNQCLINKSWESIGELDSVNDMAVKFSQLVNDALDDIAPLKTFTSKANYKSELTEDTKKLMNERDKARSAIHKTTGDKWLSLSLNQLPIFC